MEQNIKIVNKAKASSLILFCFTDKRILGLRRENALKLQSWDSLIDYS